MRRLVRPQTSEMTRAWVMATVVRLPPGGRRIRTPGDKIKARKARYRNITRFILYTHTFYF